MLHAPIGGVLPVFEEIDLQVEVGVVQWRVVEVAKAMTIAVLVAEADLARLLRRRHPLEQERVIARFGPEDEAQIQRLQMADVRTIGGQAIFHDDQLQMGMLATHIAQ